MDTCLTRIALLLLLLPATLFGAESKLITEGGFASVWLWQLSNTTVTDEKGLSLSQETTKHYETPKLLWTGKEIGSDIYLGTAETASILKLDENYQETEIYSSSNHSLVGAIAQDKDGIIAALSPESILLHLDADGKEVTNTSLSNNYIWDIVPNPKGGFYILTGADAEVYEYDNYVLSKPLAISNEEHLLEGLYIDNTLWVLGEKALYYKDGDKFIALAGFQGTASSFTYINNHFYIIQSVTKENSNNELKPQVTSLMTSVSRDGIVEELYDLQGFYFTSISSVKDQIVIGADKFGLYVFYDLITRKSYYASLGEGKILDMFYKNNQLFFLSSDKSALWSLGPNVTREGSFISEVYDTGAVSQWGQFSSSIETPPNTKVQFYIQSGVTADPSYWRDWKTIKKGEKISVPNARYVRYKAELSSDGKTAPYIFAIEFPYTQINTAPIIKSFSLEQKDASMILTWEATDPNKDSLEYHIYLAEDGLERVKLTERPISTTNFTFPNHLYPSGNKRVTLVASDRPSNSDSSALETSFTSLPVVFDSEAPIIGKIDVTKSSDKAIISVVIEDKYHILKKVSYLINGGNEVSLNPIDGIYDAKKESFNFSIPLKNTLFLQIKAVDKGNNQSFQGLTILPK